MANWRPRRVRSEDERGGSSGFLSLDEGQKFLGYALFAGDPAKDEPGYYEYLQHWDTKTNRSIPCAGDDCPFCEEGDKPRDVALTLWNVLKDERGNELGENGDGELRIFRANSILIKQLTEMRAEQEKIKGVQFRVTRLDDRGNYMLQPKTKNLPATQVKELLKSKDAPDFDQMVTSQLNKAMEGLSVARAMDDDDDDKPAKKKKAKAKAKPEPEANGDWPDSLDEDTVTVKKVAKDGNWIEVESDEYEGTKKVWTTDGIEFDLTDLSKGDEVTLTTGEQDDDEEYILTDEPVTAEEEAEEEDAEEEDDEKGAKAAADDELPDSIEDEQFSVVSIDTTNQTIDVKNDDLDLEFTLFFLDKGPASKVDFDDYEEGTVIKIDAEKDSIGDMVATKVPEVVEEEKPAKKKAKATVGKGTKTKAKAKTKTKGKG